MSKITFTILDSSKDNAEQKVEVIVMHRGQVGRKPSFTARPPWVRVNARAFSHPRLVPVNGVSQNSLDTLPAAGQGQRIEHIIHDLIVGSKLSVRLHPQIEQTEFCGRVLRDRLLSRECQGRPPFESPRMRFRTYALLERAFANAMQMARRANRRISPLR